MKAFRCWYWFLATLVVAVTAFAISSAQVLADSVAFTVNITDTNPNPNDNSYSQTFTFSGSPPLTTPPDGFGPVYSGPSSPGPSDSYDVWTPDTSVFDGDFTAEVAYQPSLHSLILNFAADADDVFATTFDIKSTAQGIGPITGGALLYFQGSLTGLDYQSFGEPVTGAFGDGGSLQAYYGATATPTTPFAIPSLISTFAPDGFDTYLGSGSTGNVTVPGTIASIQSEWDFTLAPGEGANGTSNFEPSQVPEPSSLVLLALGSLPILALGRRLRKRAS